MSNGHRWSRFWWADWHKDDALRMCSLAAQGLWMRLLCLAHEATPRGHVLVNGKNPPIADIAVAAGGRCTEKEVTKLLAELEERGVFSRTTDGVMYSRRMVRDTEAAEGFRQIGKRGGNSEILRGTVPKEERSRPYRRSDSPIKTERIFARSEGKCHWCGVELTRDKPGPTFFQVDHVVAIRDGGTNDEDNLVASCSDCNYQRARQPNGDDKRPPFKVSDSNPLVAVGMQSDTNQEKFRHQPQDTESESEAEARTLPIVPLVLSEMNPRASGVNPRALGTNPRGNGEPDPFEAWYAQYPRKVAKRAAAKAYAAAIKRGAYPPDLLAGLQRATFSRDPQFQPHPATWLNQDRWLDQSAEPRKPMFDPSKLSGAMAARWRLQQEINAEEPETERRLLQ